MVGLWVGLGIAGCTSPKSEDPTSPSTTTEPSTSVPTSTEDTGTVVHSVDTADTGGSTDTGDSAPVYDTGPWELAEIACVTERADCTAQITRTEVSPQGDRVIAEATETFSSCGLSLTYERDDGLDGDVDEGLTRVHDANDYLVSLDLMLRVGPTVVNSTSTFTYYGDGLRHVDEYSSGGFGWRTTHYYDGLRRLERYDLEGQGQVTTVDVEHTGDEKVGSTVHNINGQVWLRTEHVRTATQHELWTYETGYTDEYERTTYDTDGRVVAYDFDRGANGSFERKETLTYDADGRLAQIATDLNDDGVVDERDDYVWTCP
jgi:hypothetical protein